MLIFSFLGISSVAKGEDSRCYPLKIGDNGWSARVENSGAYCATADIIQSVPLTGFLLPHQPVPRSPLLNIAQSNVSIDLAGHTFRAKQPSGRGLWLNGSGEIWIQNARVFNGTIRTEKNPAVFMVYAWNNRSERFKNTSLANSVAIADNINDYKNTSFVLEDLLIEASDIAVVMQGKKNIIRRCKIIGGNSTVNLYGPGLIFEDNEIILNASETKADGEAPVALYLEDADGSIVRNNRFTIRGRAAGSEAIVIKKSANVIVQGNSVNGEAQRFKLLDHASSVVPVK